MCAILRFNVAGRWYVIGDGGVEVLIRVNNDINCVFLHLLENPRLYDRRAVEIVTGDKRNGTNLTGGSGGGKQEQASVYEGKESRRRIAYFRFTGPK
jgi:hypothetical protein